MRKYSDGRVWRSREEWDRILDRFESSGMTAAAFCRREKIAKGSFEKWKKKRGGRSTARATAPAFVEWPAPSGADRSAASPRAAELEPGEFELTLPGSVVLRWKS